jgi:hypothetical protein
MKIFCISVVAVLLASCSKVSESEAPKGALNREFSCKEPLPDFSLGPNSNPSDAQVASLCACLWENLSPEGRETGRLLAENRPSEISPESMSAFPARFGEAMQRCGGMEL